MILKPDIQVLNNPIYYHCHSHDRYGANPENPPNIKKVMLSNIINKSTLKNEISNIYIITLKYRTIDHKNIKNAKIFITCEVKM